MATLWSVPAVQTKKCLRPRLRSRRAFEAPATSGLQHGLSTAQSWGDHVLHKNGIGSSPLCPKTAQKCAEQHSFSATEGMLAQINYHRTWSGCRGLGATGKQRAAPALGAKVTKVAPLEIDFGPFKAKRNSQIPSDHSPFQRFSSLRTGLLASTRKALQYRNAQLNAGHGGTSRTK